MDSQQISAAIKDTKLQGDDALDLSFNIPVKFENFLFGLKCKLTNKYDIGADSVFAKKSIDTGLDGKLTVAGDFNLKSNRLKTAFNWVSEQLNLKVNTEANNVDGFTNVDVTKSLTVSDRNIDVSAAYDAVKKVFRGGVDVQVDAANVGVVFDSEDNDVTLAVSYDVDEDTKVTPSISSKAELGLGVTRRWTGGKVNALLKYPEEKVVVQWQDNGVNGVWNSKVEVPVRDTKNTKVSLSRDFVY